MNSIIELIDMEFFARHGCFTEEKIIGGKFIVNLKVEGDFSKAATTDNLADALNYKELYDIVKEQMNLCSNLLENVAQRIIDKILSSFNVAQKVSVSVAKVAPPLGGKLFASKVTISKSRGVTA